MRFLVNAFITFLVFLLCLRGMLVFDTVSLKETSLGNAMDLALCHSLEAACIDKEEGIYDEDTLYGAFCKELFVFLSPADLLTVTVYEIDYEKGILDVEASISYQVLGVRKESRVRKRGEVEIY